MTSQPIARIDIDSFTFDSFVRSYHVYKERWELSQDWRSFAPRERAKDTQCKCVVAIKKCSETTGPVGLSPSTWPLLCLPLSRDLLDAAMGWKSHVV